MQVLGDAERKVLAAVCDTVVPSIEREPDPDGFWARSATEMGIHLGVEELITASPTSCCARGLVQLLGRDRRPGDPARARPGVARADPAQHLAVRPRGRGGRRRADRDDPVHHLRRARREDRPERELARCSATRGRSRRRPRCRRRSSLHVPEGEETLEADVCIVGSGAGGSVIAATLAERGHGRRRARRRRLLQRVRLRPARVQGLPGDVLARRAHADRGRQRQPGQRAPRWAAAPRSTGPTACGPSDWVREQWASEHGLEGVDGPDFDRHLDAVWSGSASPTRAAT